MERTKNLTDVTIVSGNGEALTVRVRPAQDQQVGERPVPSRYFDTSAQVSRIAAAILLVPGIVVIGLLIVLVRLASRGPGIYRQLRVGKNGQTFFLYKVRTMRHDAEDGTGPVWAKTSDPRTTRIGAVLRKIHLDEFPQLINVLRGEMALVGPRPERPEFTKILVKKIPGYMDRVSVLPGITGLAQINLQPDVSLDCVRRKQSLDIQYIGEANAWFDLRILACTLLRLVNVKGNGIAKLFRIDRQPKALPGDAPTQFDAHDWKPSATGGAPPLDSSNGDVPSIDGDHTTREHLAAQRSPPI